MAVIDELLVALGVDVDEASFARGNAALGGLVQGGVDVAAAIGAAVTGLFALAKATADYTDDAHDAAAAIGLDAEALLQLRWATERATGSADGLEGALLRLAKSAQDAIDGGEATATAFRRLGIGVETLRGKKPDAILRLIADGMAQIPDDTERAALAMDLLGRTGARLVPLLNEGGKGIDALRDRAKALGVVVSEVDEAAAGEFNDTLDDLTTVAGGLARRVGTGLIPTFTRWGKTLLELYDRNRDVIGQRLDLWIGAIDRGLRALEGPLGVIVAGFGALAAVRAGKTLVDIASALPLIGPAAGGAASALGRMARPLGIIVIAMAALEDVFVTASGGDSLITRIATWFGADDKTLAQIQLMAKYVQDLAGAIERVGRLELGRLAWLFGADEAAANIANSPAFIPDPFDGMGPNGVRFSQDIDAERARFSAAVSTPASAGGSGQIPSYLLAQPNVNMTVNVSGGDPTEVRSAVRDGVLDAYGQFPAAQ